MIIPKIQCETCEHSTSCPILNSYKCHDYAVAVDSNFSSIPTLPVEINSQITDYELAID